MKGDFSRNTFDPLRHFSRVLVQQGRLQLDADSNEQSSILLHYLRTLACDLIGNHGGPAGHFAPSVGAGLKFDFAIAKGHYYVDGILCENDREDLTYSKQVAYDANLDKIEPGETHLVYIDVWERHVTALDDDSIREVALGHADTATRAQVMWQLRVAARTPDGKPLPQAQNTDWMTWLGQNGWPDQWLAEWQPPARGQLKAMGRSATNGDTAPCIISPEARFRGLENQLYRVEIHRSGPAGTASFKWSRDNGSVVFAVKSLAGGVLTLAHSGRGDRANLAAGDWVEIIDDSTALRGAPGVLAKIISVDPDEDTVTIEPTAAASLPSYDEDDYAARHVQIRRWDHKASASTGGNKPKLAPDGALLVEEDRWLALEDGVQVMFMRQTSGGHRYRSGDYWEIPARTATGDVEWPGPVGQPEARPPHGVAHHYAPIGIIGVSASEVIWAVPLLKQIKPVV